MAACISYRLLIYLQAAILSEPNWLANIYIFIYMSVCISWKSFQQKAALGKARAAELNNVVEGEKLHSDSGVFLDSHSLQESQPSKGKHSSLRSPPHLHVRYTSLTDTARQDAKC